MNEFVSNPIIPQLLDACMAVHRELGPGLLESIYERALAVELQERGLSVREQVQVPLRYHGHDLGADLKLDMLVADSVIVELKSVEHLNPIAQSQLFTYMKLMHIHHGVLVNFNVVLLKDGFHPYYLSLKTPSPA